MRNMFARFLSAAAISLILSSGGTNSASAQSVMKQCGDQWKAAKAAGTTNGQTWPQFLAQCRAQQKASNATAPAQSTSAPVPTAPAPPPTQTSAGDTKTASQCNAEYAANKAAIKASGQTKRDFVAACRTGSETIPQGAAITPPAPAPAPTQSGSLFPWQQPASPAPAPSTYAPAPAPGAYGSAPAQAPTAPPYSSLPTPMGAGEFASDQQAHARCPTDTVVWVNTRSRVYHFAGAHNYGHTKEGAYMCEADAKTAGDRAAMNEKHP
jgi:hypothetical protein